MKPYIIAILILAVLLGVLIAPTVEQRPLLTQNISDHQIKVLMLLVANVSNVPANWQQSVDDAIFNNGVDAFYYLYNGDHFNVTYARVDNLNFYANFVGGLGFPWNAITYYYSLIKGTAQQQVVNSANILYVMNVEKLWEGSHADVFQCGADWFVSLDGSDRRFLLAHEFGHWFGAWDRYYGSPYYNASDPYNSVNLMSVDWGWGNLVLAPSTLSDIIPQTNNWTQIGPRFTAWFFFTPGSQWRLTPPPSDEFLTKEGS